MGKCLYRARLKIADPDYDDSDVIDSMLEALDNLYALLSHKLMGEV
jgi:hypothetical protein